MDIRLASHNPIDRGTLIAVWLAKTEIFRLPKISDRYADISTMTTHTVCGATERKVKYDSVCNGPHWPTWEQMIRIRVLDISNV